MPATEAASDLRVGQEVEVDVLRVAHGGHCIAHFGGRTLFVRHALPGERVLARITQVSRKIVRADAIRVLWPSPSRVEAPCRWAAPGACGGCDLQHVLPAAQRDWKTEVLRSSLARFAGLDPELPPVGTCSVEQLPGSADGLHWMTRVRWATAADGTRGLRGHRSHEVVPVDHCLIAEERIDSPDTHAAPTTVRQVRHRRWEVPAPVFWQVHHALPEALVGEVLDQGRPEAGETWWDLFSGAGLMAAFLGEAVGAGGAVVAVESDAAAVGCGEEALADLPMVQFVRADVDAWIHDRPSGDATSAPAGIVVDPPRSGAGEGLMCRLLAVRPSRLVYVACDPVALARDARVAMTCGYRLERLRAFDAFPMTHHFESVALFVPDS